MGAWARPYPLRRSHVRRFVHTLSDGARTTVHVAAHPARSTRVTLALMERPLPLASWCAQENVAHALVGGFFLRQADGTPLGEVWRNGERISTVPFDEPWGATRSCVAIDEGRVRLAPRDDLPPRPGGDLLQAGPLLVAGRLPVVHDGFDPEGFSANQAQFDSDITVGRYPRAALGMGRDWLLAVACDGRSEHDAGLTLRELAELMAALGADRAINLDGGGSTSLVHDGILRNVPREEHGIELLAGRPVVNALVFEAI
ncbi:MAG TPA: phosphodiester glycosidase family protein [Thermoleophilaceae bacterium]|nr:phosphodiester glycosidase family protein [Thermoleophilaceae bacterium]